MFENAKNRFTSRIIKAKDWATFMTEINKSNIILTPWCDVEECEITITKKSVAESKELSEGEVPSFLIFLFHPNSFEKSRKKFS